jgi:NitT/TauT family transport system permease protein
MQALIQAILSRLLRAIPSIFVAALMLLIWEFLAGYFHVPTFLFPAPSKVLMALTSVLKSGDYLPHLQATLSAVTIGYLFGCIAGIGLGAAIAEWQVLQRMLYPYIVILQSIPKIALAPLFIMFGFGLISKTVTVALLCFFPLLVNTMTAMAGTEPDRIALLRAMTASRWQIFREVKLPSAAGAIFAGLQVSIVLALIGALVAEFVGSDRGLGIMIEAARSNLDTPGMFAVLCMLAAIGLVATKCVQWLQQRIVFWETKAARLGGEV